MKRISEAAAGILLFSFAFVQPPALLFADTTANGSGATAAPEILFETNFLDLGTVSGVERVPGVFKFKNAGNAALKVEPPSPTCDCTDARVVPPVLEPGESGEIAFVLKADRAMNIERAILVRSNDPRNPKVELTFHINYTPLYKLSPATLWLTLPAGKDELTREITITRTDGKPLGIRQLKPSKAWVEAVMDPGTTPLDNTAKIRVTVHRPSGPPAPLAERVEIWGANESGGPLQTISLVGDILGELSADPSQMYWAIPYFGTSRKDYPDSVLTKTIELRSVLNHDVEITQATSDIKGLSVTAVPLVPRRKFNLVLKFAEAPKDFAKGKVIVKTSLASLPELDIPLTVAVPPAP